MIVLENVFKKYVTNRAIEGISLQFEKGKITGIIGENGSGKSTTLKLIAGLVRPSSGLVEVDGQKVSRKISSIVAYMSELDHMYPFFTIGEAVEFYDTQFNDFDVEKAAEILSFMKLEESQKVRHLSKGNKGRLKIALTLSRNAPYLLLDEPFSGLDPMVRQTIIKGLIRYIDLEKQSLIITTHEIREIEPVLDDVIAIQSGKVIGRENVEAIRERGMDVVAWLEKNYEGVK